MFIPIAAADEIIDEVPSLLITEVQTTGTAEDGTDMPAEEFVELTNLSSDTLDVIGWKVNYINGSGTVSLLANLDGMIQPYGSVLIAHDGYPLLPGLVADKYFGTGSNSIFGKTVGSVELVDNTGQTVDLVGWGTASVDEPWPKLSQIPPGYSAKRIIPGHPLFGLGSDYTWAPATQPLTPEGGGLLPDACPEVSGMQVAVPEGYELDCVTPVQLVVDCTGIIINEIGANLVEQYVEIYNPTNEAIALAGCMLETNRNSNKYTYTQEELSAGEYLTIAIAETDLTLTKTTTGIVYLLSSDGLSESDVQVYSELDEDTSWSRFDDGWYQTYALTPSAENVDQEYPACDEGYFRNTETGRCNKMPVEDEITPCAVGQYRSLETNRCRNLSLPSSLKPCRADQYRNPETNRCRNVTTASSLKPCAENQYRSEETNRCRNKEGSVLPEAAFKVQPVDNQESAFAGWLALGGVGAVAGGYAGWEWRRELANGWRRFFGLFKK